jgi:hypothetical protein
VMSELRQKIEDILGTAILQCDGEFIWNEDELVDKLVKLVENSSER